MIQGMSRLNQTIAASIMTSLGAVMIVLGQITVLPSHFV